MTTHTRRAWALSAALVAAATLSGCAGQPQQPQTVTVTRTGTGTTGSPATAATAGPVPRAGADPAQVDRGDHRAVAAAFATAAFTVDARTDSSVQDATTRAAAFAGERYAAELTGANRPTWAGGDAWAQLRAHDGHTQVRLEEQPAMDPPASKDQAGIVYAVTVTPTGAGGWTGQIDHWTAFVTLARQTSAGAWQVTGMNVSPA